MLNPPPSKATLKQSFSASVFQVDSYKEQKAEAEKIYRVSNIINKKGMPKPCPSRHN